MATHDSNTQSTEHKANELLNRQVSLARDLPRALLITTMTREPGFSGLSLGSSVDVMLHVCNVQLSSVEWTMCCLLIKQTFKTVSSLSHHHYLAALPGCNRAL